MCVNSLLLPLFPLSSLLTGIPSVEEMARIRNKYHILTKNAFRPKQFLYVKGWSPRVVSPIYQPNAV